MASNNQDKQWDFILVTLHKGKIEAEAKAKDVDGIVNYTVLGDYDRLSIRMLKPKEGKAAEWFNDCNNVIGTMFDETVEISQKSALGESFQNLFAVKAISSSSSQKNFWEESEPYLFMTMLQFSDDSDVHVLEKALDKLKEYFKKNGCQDYYIYYSLDCCDLLIFIKSETYKNGVKIIHELKRSMPKLHYSYTKCGMKLETISKHSGDAEQIKGKITVCAVVKNFGNYEKWRAKFKRKYPDLKNSDGKVYSNVYARLGNEDICINIFNCSIEDIAGALVNGIFSSSEIANVFMRLRVHFDINDEEYQIPIIGENGENAGENERDNKYKGYFVDVFRNKFNDDKNKSRYERLVPTVKKALFEMLNACSHLQKTNFALDVQVCVKNVFPLFLEAMEQAETVACSEVAYNESIIKFIHGILSVVNGSLHADRMFFQVPGFNAVIYEFPSKLLIFYNAYMRVLANSLSPTGSEAGYRFLLAPDLYQRTGMIKFFDNEMLIPQRRLLKVRIPVEILFEPKALLPILSHEAAHYISDFRARETRAKFIIQMFACLAANDVLSHDDDKWSELIERMKNKKCYNPQNYSSEPLSKTVGNDIFGFINIKLREKLAEYSTDLKKFNADSDIKYYLTATKMFLRNETEKLFSDKKFIENITILVKKRINQLDGACLGITDIGNRCRDMVKYEHLIEKATKRIIDNKDDYINLLHQLVCESHSDLLMVEALNMGMEEYLKKFYDEVNRENGVDSTDFLNNRDATLERIVSIIKVLDWDIRTWHPDSNYKEFADVLKPYVENWGRDIKDYNLKFNAFPKEIIEYNVKYLSQCLRDINAPEVAFKDTRRIYKSIDNGIIEFMKVMKEESRKFNETVSLEYEKFLEN